MMDPLIDSGQNMLSQLDQCWMPKFLIAKFAFDKYVLH
jgi:hypothetical protein